MKWDHSLNRKWIALTQTQGMNFDTILTNMCLLVARNAAAKAEGFTVVEPRDFNGAFFERLKLRIQSGPLSESSFSLYYPEFLEHRVGTLISTLDPARFKTNKTSFIALKLVQDVLSIRPKMRIVNVDDSPVLLKLLQHAFTACGWIDVVGQVSKSTDAVDTILRLSPDVVTLDIQMPTKNGVEVLSDLLAKRHFPVLMISSLNLEEGSLVFDALNRGAFDYVQKPSHDDRESFRDEIVTKALLAVEGRNPQASLHKIVEPKSRSPELRHDFAANLIWCFGASTGGTQALTRIFTSLPTQIPPTLIVQHIPPVFSKAFAESLNNLCPFMVKEAVNGEPLLKNYAYVAPGGMQMGIDKVGDKYLIALSDDAPVNRFKPSVDYLFQNLAQKRDLQFVAGVLTGMGKDGAAGLLALKEAGARTFAQDESSSTVYGMPRAAFELGAAEQVCHIDQIAQHVLSKSVAKRAG